MFDRLDEGIQAAVIRSGVSITSDDQEQRRAAGDPKTLATLLGCLPAEGESGSWAREASAAIIYAGGSWTDVKPDHVQKAIPGMSKTTARQYWAKTERLLRVAMTRLNHKEGQ